MTDAARATPAAAGGEPGVDAHDVRFDLRPHLGQCFAELTLPGAPKPDAARQAIDDDAVLADHRRKCAPHGAHDELELGGAILRVAEAEREPGVVLGAGLDVRHAEIIATYAHIRAEPRGLQRAFGSGLATAEEQAEQRFQRLHGRRLHRTTGGAKAPRIKKNGTNPPGGCPFHP